MRWAYTSSLGSSPVGPVGRPLVLGRGAVEKKRDSGARTGPIEFLPLVALVASGRENYVKLPLLVGHSEQIRVHFSRRKRTYLREEDSTVGCAEDRIAMR